MDRQTQSQIRTYLSPESFADPTHRVRILPSLCVAARRRMVGGPRRRYRYSHVGDRNTPDCRTAIKHLKCGVHSVVLARLCRETVTLTQRLSKVGNVTIGLAMLHVGIPERPFGQMGASRISQLEVMRFSTTCVATPRTLECYCCSP